MDPPPIAPSRTHPTGVAVVARSARVEAPPERATGCTLRLDRLGISTWIGGIWTLLHSPLAHSKPDARFDAFVCRDAGTQVAGQRNCDTGLSSSLSSNLRRSRPAKSCTRC